MVRNPTGFSVLAVLHLVVAAPRPVRSFDLTIEIRQYPNAWFASKVTSGFTLHDLARIP
jgi:hypothetical protein